MPPIVVIQKMNGDVYYRKSGHMESGELLLAVFENERQMVDSGFALHYTGVAKTRSWDETQKMRKAWVKDRGWRGNDGDSAKVVQEDPSARRDREALQRPKQDRVQTQKPAVERPMCPLLLVTPMPNAWGR